MKEQQYSFDFNQEPAPLKNEKNFPEQDFSSYNPAVLDLINNYLRTEYQVQGVSLSVVAENFNKIGKRLNRFDIVRLQAFFAKEHEIELEEVLRCFRQMKDAYGLPITDDFIFIQNDADQLDLELPSRQKITPEPKPNTSRTTNKYDKVKTHVSEIEKALRKREEEYDK